MPITQPAAVPAGKSFWLAWRGTLVLLVCACLPYLSSLRDPFFSDDYLHIERLSLVHPGTLLLALRSWILRAEDMSVWWTPGDLAVPYFRPLVTLSFYCDHRLWGMQPFGYHLTNLLLHLGTTWLCLAIGRIVLKTPFSAWAAALLFALHPCHTEAVAWISGRTDLLAGFFCALAFYCYLRYLRSGRSRPLGVPRTLPWLAGVFVAFLLALCAKEIALSLPLILIAHGVLFPGADPVPAESTTGSLRRRLAVPLALLGVATVYLGLRLALLGRGVPPHPFAHGPGDPDMPRQLLTALPLYLADLVLFVPAEPVLTYPFWLRHPVLLVLFCVTALWALRDAVRQGKNQAASRFGLIWVLLSLLPVLPVTVGERFLYLPSLGYALLVGAKLPEVPRPPWAALGFALLALVVVTGKGWQFSALSRSSRQTVQDALLALDQAPQARQVLVIDLPAQSALAFSHALRLFLPGRPLQVEVLSIAPHFLSLDRTFRSSVEFAPDGLIIRSLGPAYLGSYIEQAYLGQRPPLRPGEIIQRRGYTVTILAASGADLRAFAVRFPPQNPEQRLILRGQGFHLGRL